MLRLSYGTGWIWEHSIHSCVEDITCVTTLLGRSILVYLLDSLLNASHVLPIHRVRILFDILIISKFNTCFHTGLPLRFPFLTVLAFDWVRSSTRRFNHTLEQLLGFKRSLSTSICLCNLRCLSNFLEGFNLLDFLVELVSLDVAKLLLNYRTNIVLRRSRCLWLLARLRLLLELDVLYLEDLSIHGIRHLHEVVNQLLHVLVFVLKVSYPKCLLLNLILLIF